MDEINNILVVMESGRRVHDDDDVGCLVLSSEVIIIIGDEVSWGGEIILLSG
jgi:hypothetical protein